MMELREEMLISHVIDGDATSTQWQELEGLASTDPLVWKRLAQAQRDSALLSAALGRASLVAEAVELPRNDGETISSDRVTHVRFNRLGAWTGWAVAALVMIVASVRFAQPLPSGFDPSSGVQTTSFGSAAQAFQAYLDKGRESGEVVGEIPGKVLVETKPVRSGIGVEVIYLRQVIERTVVPDLYQLTRAQETGKPTLVRYQPHNRNSM